MTNQIGKSDIRVEYRNRVDGKQTDITQIVTGVTWEGDIKQAYRKLSINTSNTIDGRKQAVQIVLGSEIRFYNHGTELFRGVIFTQEINSKGREVISVYDTNVYLTKNGDSRKFKNATATDIINRICGDFGIPTGTISNTGYVIPKLFFTNKTLYDIMVISLTETQKHTGDRYFLVNDLGDLTLRKRSDVVTDILIENGKTLTAVSYSKSIEDTRSQVKVAGKDGDTERSVIKRNKELSDDYGVMQHYESVSDNITKSGLTQIADQLLAEKGTIQDEANVTALGIDSVVASTSVYVRDTMTKINGAYYVSSDKHTYNTDGTHTMSLKLSATDDLPRLDYEGEA